MRTVTYESVTGSAYLPSHLILGRRPQEVWIRCESLRRRSVRRAGELVGGTRAAHPAPELLVDQHLADLRGEQGE